MSAHGDQVSRIPDHAWCWLCGQNWHKFHLVVYSWKCQPVVGDKPSWWRFGWSHVEPESFEWVRTTSGLMVILRS